MIYNTNFDVKYFDIYKELVQKKNTETGNREYTLEDIDDICNKLYRDELTSVFFAENIFDDKIDRGLKKVLELMKQSDEFKYMLEELLITLFPYDITSDHTNSKGVNDANKEYEFLLIVTFFSFDIFYLMHKIVCLQLNKSVIPIDLLNELKKLTNDVLTNNI